MLQKERDNLDNYLQLYKSPDIAVRHLIRKYYYDSVRDVYITRRKKDRLPELISWPYIEYAILTYMLDEDEEPNSQKRRQINTAIIKLFLTMDTEPAWNPTDKFIDRHTEEFIQAVTELEAQSSQETNRQF